MDKTRAEQVTPIYLDYFSSTPLLAEVAKILCDHYRNIQHQVNASSQHAMGKAAASIIEKSRNAILSSLNLPSNPLVFTSSATESIHLAILGAIEAYPRPHYHLLTWSTEHAATLGAFERARRLHGAFTHILQPKMGVVDCDELESILKKTPIFLVSISWVQHEIGIIQPWQDIYRLAKQYGALLHLDASQAIGKLPVIFDNDCPDYITLPSHKCFGPKGIAALYIAKHRNRRVAPLFLGGGHQYGLRSGTEPVGLIQAMAYLYTYILKHQTVWQERNLKYQHRILHTLQKTDAQVFSSAHVVPQVLMLRIPSVHHSLWQDLIMSSQGSACGHQHGKLSPMLLNLGASSEVIAESFRISWCHLNAESDMELLNDLFFKIFNKV